MQTESRKELVASFSKNATEVFQIHLSSYNNKQYIDLRLWFYPKDSQSLMPTKKGVVIPTEQVGELIDGLSKIRTNFKQEKRGYKN